jgi:cytoskeletal protein CcmA (bactofilin family)
MKASPRALLLTTLLLLLTGCQFQDSYSGRIILSGSHTIGPQQSIDGELVMTGGDVTLAPGSHVTGSVHIFGGEVTLDGQVDGDVLVVSGSVEIEPRAVIQGDLNWAGGTVTLDEDARVLGSVTRPIESPSAETEEQAQGWRWVSLFLTLPLLIALAYITTRFLPGPLANIEQAATRHVIPSAALGLLAWVVGLSFLLLIAYTILLIPLSLIGFFVMLIAATYGTVPYAIYIGRWISRRMRWNASRPLQAVMGMVVLSLLVEIARLIPLVRTVFPLLLFTAGLGSVLLTRFGLQRYIPPNLDAAAELVEEK